MLDSIETKKFNGIFLKLELTLEHNEWTHCFKIRTNFNLREKKLALLNDKIVKVERLGLLRDVYSQLQDQDCTDVVGNPVSVIPVFALQVLYSLGWGGASDLGSIMSSSGSRTAMNSTTININFSINVDDQKKPVKTFLSL